MSEPIRTQPDPFATLECSALGGCGHSFRPEDLTAYPLCPECAETEKRASWHFCDHCEGAEEPDGDWCPCCETETV